MPGFPCLRCQEVCLSSSNHVSGDYKTEASNGKICSETEPLFQHLHGTTSGREIVDSGEREIQHSFHLVAGGCLELTVIFKFEFNKLSRLISPGLTTDGGKPQNLEKNLCQGFSTTIPHRIAWDWNQRSAVRGQTLTAWDTARRNWRMVKCGRRVVENWKYPVSDNVICRLIHLHKCSVGISELIPFLLIDTALRINI